MDFLSLYHIVEPWWRSSLGDLTGSIFEIFERLLLKLQNNLLIIFIKLHTLIKVLYTKLTIKQ